MFNGWVLAIIIIYLIELGISLYKHNEVVEVKYNFWASLLKTAEHGVLIYMAIKTGGGFI